MALVCFARTAFETMSLPVYVKALSATGAFLVICAALRAEAPNDLITKGDAFDGRLQAKPRRPSAGSLSRTWAPDF